MEVATRVTYVDASGGAHSTVVKSEVPNEVVTGWAAAATTAATGAGSPTPVKIKSIVISQFGVQDPGGF